MLNALKDEIFSFLQVEISYFILFIVKFLTQPLDFHGLVAERFAANNNMVIEVIECDILVVLPQSRGEGIRYDFGRHNFAC